MGERGEGGEGRRGRGDMGERGEGGEGRRGRGDMGEGEKEESTLLSPSHSTGTPVRSWRTTSRDSTPSSPSCARRSRRRVTVPTNGCSSTTCWRRDSAVTSCCRRVCQKLGWRRSCIRE